MSLLDQVGPAGACAAGWFGKIRALGDFASRRLPVSFVEPWDEWLSVGLLDAQSRLDDQWPRVYADAPTWCFSVGPGVIDGSRWTGVLAPSADRVGRCFPLTIAMAGDVPADLAFRTWAAMIAAAKRTEDPRCDAACLDAALQAAFRGELQSPAWHGSDLGVLARWLQDPSPTGSLWWDPARAQAIDPQRAWVSSAGLPLGEDFFRMIAP